MLPQLGQMGMLYSSSYMRRGIKVSRIVICKRKEESGLSPPTFKHLKLAFSSTDTRNVNR